MKVAHYRTVITMFAKVFSQILDSSLAENYQVRLVFEDFLKLADKDGIVDMTRESISRRTNVPFDIVSFGVGELEKPDKASRTPDLDGRRIVRLDAHRDWGWKIVNFTKYRESATKEMLKMSEADRKAEYRKRKGFKESRSTTNVPDSPNSVPDTTGRSWDGSASASASLELGYVYYATALEAIKIGFSKNPWARISELKTASPDIKLIAVEPGSREIERVRHEQFNSSHTEGEWFTKSPELMAFVSGLSKAAERDLLPVGFPANEEEARKIGEMAAMPSEFVMDSYYKASSRGGCDAKGIAIRNFRHFLQSEWKYERERIAKGQTSSTVIRPPHEKTTAALKAQGLA